MNRGFTAASVGFSWGAPKPASKEMQALKCGDGSWGCCERYTDAVWRNIRMNNTTPTGKVFAAAQPRA